MKHLRKSILGLVAVVMIGSLSLTLSSNAFAGRKVSVNKDALNKAKKNARALRKKDNKAVRSAKKSANANFKLDTHKVKAAKQYCLGEGKSKRECKGEVHQLKAVARSKKQVAINTAKINRTNNNTISKNRIKGAKQEIQRNRQLGRADFHTCRANGGSKKDCKQSK